MSRCGLPIGRASGDTTAKSLCSTTTLPIPRQWSNGCGRWLVCVTRERMSLTREILQQLSGHTHEEFPELFHARATIVTELVGSVWWRWLGALWLACFTLIASFVANSFWTLPPAAERFVMANAFFEHLSLVGGFVFVALADLRHAR